MKTEIRGPAFLAVALLAGCAGDPHTHVGGLSRAERAGIVATDSGCDLSSARDAKDPSSPCFVSRRGHEK
jgi:hypothetical protein